MVLDPPIQQLAGILRRMRRSLGLALFCPKLKRTGQHTPGTINMEPENGPLED